MVFKNIEELQDNKLHATPNVVMVRPKQKKFQKLGMPFVLHYCSFEMMMCMYVRSVRLPIKMSP